ncbi:hypothetical protein CPC16_008759 [Podila verticillata]|nr:hypothetical protein BGZ59_007299 [Podila verticillata]KAF9383793.1 hypothetical protein CPC16_008759 [Podila verticillata]KFH69818.1 hypothetical protein MVEG_04622 [Podila verticillata NRRL 6337]
MHLSIFFNTLVVLAALSLAHAQLDDARAERFIAIKKRDLLGNLLPINNNSNNPTPAQPPAAPASPTDSAKPGAAGGPIPSLLSGVLSQPPVIGGTPMAPTASIPKKPQSSSDDTTGAGAPGPTAPAAESNPSEQTSLSPGLIAVVSVVFVALLVAILFSCHKIRQSRQRRHRNLDEDILKHHAGSVGYSEGGGYGMYVGKESDLWRKNLDLFHRG